MSEVYATTLFNVKRCYKNIIIILNFI